MAEREGGRHKKTRQDGWQRGSTRKPDRDGWQRGREAQEKHKKYNTDLVVDEVVQSRHRPDEGRNVDDEVHVVRFHEHGSDQLIHVKVREQVKDILHVVHDLPSEAKSKTT